MKLAVHIIHGNAFVKPDDIERAKRAAETSLACPTTKDDLEIAESAANLALTEGWRNPDGAWCELTVLPG